MKKYSKQKLCEWCKMVSFEIQGNKKYCIDCGKKKILEDKKIYYARDRHKIIIDRQNKLKEKMKFIINNIDDKMILPSGDGNNSKLEGKKK